jgi:hypothetical protein
MSIVDRVKEMFGQHPDKAKQGVEKAGDMADERTGGKHADKTDKAQEKGSDYIDQQGQEGDQGPQSKPGQAGPRQDPSNGV